MAQNLSLEVNRFDFMPLSSKAVKTDEGYLKSISILTRAGIFLYKGPNGTIRRELRPPEEVFNQDSLDSLKLKPLTKKHPKEMLDVKNIKEHQVGFVGEDIQHDQVFVSGPVLVTDEQAIDDVESRLMNQLSCGYRCVMDETPGEWEGQQYDAIQTNIRYNHVAIVERGRAGSDARIRLDSNDAICVFEDKDNAVSVEENKLDSKGRSMKKLVIDNVEYEVDDSFVPIYNQLKKDNDDLVSIKSQVEAERDNFKVKLDELTKEVETLKNDSISKEELIKLAKERADVYEVAKKVLKEEELEKLDEMEIIDIKKAILSSKFDGMEEKDETYINVRFEIFKEDGIEEKIDENAIENKKKIIGEPKKDSAEEKYDAEEARKKYIDGLVNGYKKEEK